MLQDRSYDVLHAFLEASGPPIDTAIDRESFALVKEAYSACMNQTEVKRVGVQPIVDVLNGIVKAFPVSSSAYMTLNSTILGNSDTSQLRNVLLFLEQIGLSTVVDIMVGRDDKDPVSEHDACN